jgi:DNA-binding CsgD family transcriptional regulator
MAFFNTANAEYQISGRVNLSPDWQRQIFLSTINKLDDYYKSDPSDIIQVGSINEDGSFILNGDNLPPDAQFYRLYLIKEENTEFDACVYMGGDDHNFIHIILDNHTRIHIIPDQNNNSPFANYKVSGSKPNNLLKSLSKLVFPSFYFHKIKFPSELQFSKQKLNRDLFHFADTCQNTLVSLAALVNTDMDQYFEEESERYEVFADRLSNRLPNHDYTDNYFRKLKYHQGSNVMNSNLPWWAYLLIGILIFSLLISFFRIRKLSELLKAKKQHVATIIQKKTPALTQQEEKILNLISEGKSNKEIANGLFIELSTVKTHINKLYAKLEVKNRTEAKQKAESLLSAGV